MGLKLLPHVDNLSPLWPSWAGIADCPALCRGKDGLLSTTGEALAQSFPVVLTEGARCPVDLPCRRLIGPDQQADQGGLARADLPHKCGLPPALDAKLTCSSTGLSRLIGEDTSAKDTSPCTVRGEITRDIGAAPVRVQNSKSCSAPATVLLNAGKEWRQCCSGPPQLPGVAQEAGPPAQSGLTAVRCQGGPARPLSAGDQGKAQVVGPCSPAG